MRAAAAAAPVAGAAPKLATYATLVREVSVGDEKRKALVTSAGTVSFYVEVPEKASLSLRYGQSGGTGATAKVRVTPEGKGATELFSQAAGASWADKVVSLEAFAGEIVRLDLVSEGAGEIAWSSPSIVVPKVELAAAPQAKNVIVLLIDTLPAKKLRAYDGKSRVETPALDAFAREGTCSRRAQRRRPDQPWRVGGTGLPDDPPHKGERVEALR